MSDALTDLVCLFDEEDPESCTHDKHAHLNNGGASVKDATVACAPNVRTCATSARLDDSVFEQLFESAPTGHQKQDKTSEKVLGNSESNELFNEYAPELSKDGQELERLLQQQSNAEAVERRAVMRGIDGGSLGSEGGKVAELGRLAGARYVATGGSAQPDDCFVEPSSGIRVSRRSMTVAEHFLRARMQDKRFIPLAQLKSMWNAKVLDDCDWVTFGIICRKSDTRHTQQKNEPYVIWTLTVLSAASGSKPKFSSDDDCSISLFLFGDAYKAHWKLPEGYAVGLLNARRMDKSASKALSVDMGQKVLVLGFAVDMGRCKSNSKQGQPCGAIIDRSKGELCVFHMVQEYRKYSSSRMDLNGSYTSPALTGGNTLQQLKRKCEQQYGYASSGGAAPRDAAQAKRRKVSLAQVEQRQAMGSLAQLDNLSGDDRARLDELRQAQANANEHLLNLLAKPSAGSSNFTTFLRRLQQPGAPAGSPSAPPAAPNRAAPRASAPATLPSHSVPSTVAAAGSPSAPLAPANPAALRASAPATLPFHSAPSTVARPPPKPAAAFSAVDVLRRVASAGFGAAPAPALTSIRPSPAANAFVDLDDDSCTSVAPQLALSQPQHSDPLFSCATSSIRTPLANQNAIRIIQAKGGIRKSDPNDVRAKNRPARSAAAAKNNSSEVLRDASNGASSGQATEAQPAASLGGRPLTLAEIEQLLTRRSLHAGLVDAAQQQQMQQRFERLEKKEAIEQRLESLHEVKCTIVICDICQYAFTSAHPTCREQGHKLRHMAGYKRFFECADCSYRTVAITRYPTRTCSRCDSRVWRKAGMWRGAQSAQPHELELRGEECKFLNSLH